MVGGIEMPTEKTILDLDPFISDTLANIMLGVEHVGQSTPEKITAEELLSEFLTQGIGDIQAALGIPIFGTLADLTAATVDSGMNLVWVLGYAAQDDGGTQFYKRVGGDPGHPGAVQDAASAWWEVTGDLDDRHFGVVGDGVTDDSTAMQAFFEFAAEFSNGFCQLRPNVTYVITQTVTPWSSIGFPLTVDFRGATFLQNASAVNAKRLITTGQNPVAAPVLTQDTFGGEWRNFVLNGNKQNRTYLGNETEQCALMFLQGDVTTRWKVQFRIDNGTFLNSTGDGLHVRMNTDTVVTNSTGRGNFRGGIVITGGWSSLEVRSWTGNRDFGEDQTTDGFPSRFQMEIDGGGWLGSQQVNLSLSDVEVDKWELELRGGSTLHLDSLIGRSEFWCFGLYNDIQLLDDSQLTAGTYTLEFEGDTTAPIAWNASSATVQTELNALASITAGGGVTVADATLPPLAGSSTPLTGKRVLFSGFSTRLVEVMTLDLASATGTATVESVEGQPLLEANGCRFGTTSTTAANEMRNLLNAHWNNCTWELVDDAGSPTPHALIITDAATGVPRGLRTHFTDCLFTTKLGLAVLQNGTSGSSALLLPTINKIYEDFISIRHCRFSGFNWGIQADRPGTVIVESPHFEKSIRFGIWASLSKDATYDSKLTIAGKVGIEDDVYTYYLALVSGVGGAVLTHETDAMTAAESKWTTSSTWNVEVRGHREIFSSSAPLASNGSFAGDKWTIQPFGQVAGSVVTHKAVNTHPSAAVWIPTNGQFTFTNGDTTPSVAYGRSVPGLTFRHNDSAETLVTNYDDGVDGQKITVVAGLNTTLVDGATIELPNNENILGPFVLDLVLHGTVWKLRETSNNIFSAPVQTTIEQDDILVIKRDSDGDVKTITRADWLSDEFFDLAGDATTALQPVTYQQLQSTAANSAKPNARVATTTSGTLASDFENGDTVDGVTLATNDRILIKNQASGEENGIYVVNASGAPTRATGLDSDSEADAGANLYIDEGTTNAGTGWRLVTQSPITLDTTPLQFDQIPTSATTASAVASTPAGNIAATNVQNAINELDNEKVAKTTTVTGSSSVHINASATAKTLGSTTNFTFIVPSSGIATAMIADQAVTALKMEDVGANTVVCRPEGTTGSRSSVALGTERLLGRASGNVASLDRNVVNAILTKEFAMVSGTLDQDNGDHHVIADTASPNPFVIPAPTNYIPGKTYQLTIEADATQTHNLSWNAAWKISTGDTLPTVRGATGPIVISYRVSDIEAGGTTVRATRIDYAS
jgi:hypothetical protein